LGIVLWLLEHLHHLLLEGFEQDLEHLEFFLDHGYFLVLGQLENLVALFQLILKEVHQVTLV
jgi:hypothetical protein